MARILIVDDEQRVHERYAPLLRSAGHEVITTSSIEEAHAKLQAENFDVEIWDGAIGPFELADGAEEAVCRHQDGKNVMVFSFGDKARIVAETGGVLFLSKMDGYNLVGTVQRILEKIPKGN